MKLSKSDYILGSSCTKALWLKKHKPELCQDSGAIWAKFGDDVQVLARKLYPEGIMVSDTYIDIEANAQQTFILSQKHKVLFEATALLNDGVFCRIDIMQKSDNGWDLIEIKSSNSITEEQIEDLSFQHYVFKKAGYNINRCFILHLNPRYILKNKLNLHKLFIQEDVTAQVKDNFSAIKDKIDTLLKYQNQPQEPEKNICKSCSDCDFYSYCCKEVPEYSIWNIFPKGKADKICAELRSYNVNDLIAEDYEGKRRIDIEAWQQQKIYCDKEQIREFLNQLEYPLYYLDYETIASPIPLFENSSPYQQIPFQFSLHIQTQPNGEVEHLGFLHQEKSDPRRALAESLVKYCGQKGSVVVYNAQFEKSRNEELAKIFPDLAKAIKDINSRIVDQLIPFRNRALYHYNQHSSASIKKVLPSFTDLSYNELEIHNGDEASKRYLAFLTDQLSPKEEKILFDGLDEYCGQDTFAMVVLMDVLYKAAE